ncbi:MAG: hypothetical protein EON87_19215 [Brevundimonas sp.]|nr:MAG: hypothetical protein EON87_19215 [Brevundimonas sp.]
MLADAVFVVAMATLPMQDAPRAPALTNAEACLRDNAAQAVNVSSGATDAASFLVSYLCAAPVNAASSWQRNTEMLENIRGMLEGMTRATTATADDADSTNETTGDPELVEAGAAFDFFGEGLDGVSIDPTTGEFVITGEASGIAATMIRTQTNTLGQLLNDPTPVFLRELAGRLVLEHRRGR